MAVLWLLLLVGLPTLSLGVFVWVVVQHFLTTEIPSTLKRPAKLWFMHCILLYMMTLGSILEKLRICAMPTFLQLIQGLIIIKKNPNVLTTDMHFGTVPVRLFKPKKVSCEPRRGIIIYHGGGAVIGSLDCYHGLGNLLASETDSVVLMVGFVPPPSRRPLMHVAQCSYSKMVCWIALKIFSLFCISFFSSGGSCWSWRYRKLPAYHHPILVNDCLNASIYFLKNLESFGVDSSRLVLCGESIGDDKIIAQLPKTFLVSCEHDILWDDALLYKKRLEDQSVPVSWYHVEDGFHGCLIPPGEYPLHGMNIKKELVQG
ncbi:Arylacetamide deacetylase-like 4 [Sigmodon hispidus]